jgi:hypothetical protein
MSVFFRRGQAAGAAVASRAVRWLAYAHPALMSALLALAVVVLRDGLRLRRARLLGLPRDSRRHRRLARWVVPLIALGLGGGQASMLLLRDEPPAQSVHFLLALPAAAGLLGAGALGLVLERGRAGTRLRGLHALLGAGGLLLGLAAAVAGFAILP